MIESNKREEVYIEYCPCSQSRIRPTEKPKRAANWVCVSLIFFLIFLTSTLAGIWIPNLVISASSLT